MIIPVIVGESPDDALLQAVSHCPPKHFSIFEYPVVVDLSADRIVSFNSTAFWGAFFFSDMRQVADTYIKGSFQGKYIEGDADDAR